MIKSSLSEAEYIMMHLSEKEQITSLLETIPALVRSKSVCMWKAKIRKIGYNFWKKYEQMQTGAGSAYIHEVFSVDQCYLGQKLSGKLCMYGGMLDQDFLNQLDSREKSGMQ
jgi:hypothetical protein